MKSQIEPNLDLHNTNSNEAVSFVCYECAVYNVLILPTFWDKNSKILFDGHISDMQDVTVDLASAIDTQNSYIPSEVS